MIDYFAIGLTHALLAIAAWRLLTRADLDRDPAPDAPETPVDSTPKRKGVRRA